MISIILSSHSFVCLSYSVIDSFYCIVQLCLFFSSSRSLVSISFIFCILFPRYWIIFTITLNSSSGRLPVSSSLFFWGFVFFIHLRNNSISFNFDYFSVVVF